MGEISLGEMGLGEMGQNRERQSALDTGRTRLPCKSLSSQIWHLFCMKMDKKLSASAFWSCMTTDPNRALFLNSL